MNIRPEDQIGEIVANDYRTAAVFKAAGIDFCCRGNRTLDEVIKEKGLIAEEVIKNLDSIKTSAITDAHDFSNWEPANLIDYIIEKHHTYIRQQIPVLTTYLDQICKAHGKTQPVMFEIRALFAEDAQALLQHLEAEESIVFPMIRDLASSPIDAPSASCVPLSFFHEMISTMEQEHVIEGNRWKKIEELTQNFKLQFGCKVAHVAFSLLHDFQNDLHHHIHLENNILFPGALELKNNKINANLS